MKRVMTLLLGTALSAVCHSATLSGEWLQYFNGEYDGERAICLERQDEYEIGLSASSLAIPVVDAAAGDLDHVTVLGGSFPHELIVGASIMTDEDMYNTVVAPIISKRSQWVYDAECRDYEYEDNHACHEFTADVWPDLKVVTNRKWIILNTQKPATSLVGSLSLRIGLGGTDVAATLDIPISFVTDPAFFTHPISIHQYGEWEVDFVDHFDDGWRYGSAILVDLDLGEEVKVGLPEAGTLVLTLPDQEYLEVSGADITGNSRATSDKYWSSFVDEKGFEWAYGTCHRLQAITVSKATTLTLKTAKDDEDIELRRCFFYPASAKSVGISASLFASDGGIGGLVTGLGTYKAGETAVLTAETAPGYAFDGWEVKYGSLPEGTDLTQSTLRFVVTDEMCSTAGDAWEIAVQAHWTRKPLEFYDTPVVLKLADATPQADIWKMAQTVNGAVSRDGKVVGSIQVKVGKANKNGEVMVSGTIIGLDGKKLTAKGGKVMVTGNSATATFKVKDGTTATVTVSKDGLRGSWNGADIKSADVGGSWAKSNATVSVDADDVSMFAGTVLSKLLPNGEQATAKGGKWSFAKAASVKWAKPKKGAARPEIYDEESGKGLIVDESRGKNLSGMKLTYTPKTGVFTGSFKIYALDGSGKATKLKKYTVKVTGIVVDGGGYGTATCKVPAVRWAVMVE